MARPQIPTSFPETFLSQLQSVECPHSVLACLASIIPLVCLHTSKRRAAEISLLWSLFVPELSAIGTWHIASFCLNLLRAELMALVINCTSPSPCCFPAGCLMSGTHLLVPRCLRQGSGESRCFWSVLLQGWSGPRPVLNPACLFPSGTARIGWCFLHYQTRVPKSYLEPPWHCWAPWGSSITDQQVLH